MNQSSQQQQDSLPSFVPESQNVFITSSSDITDSQNEQIHSTTNKKRNRNKEELKAVARERSKRFYESEWKKNTVDIKQCLRDYIISLNHCSKCKDEVTPETFSKFTLCTIRPWYIKKKNSEQKMKITHSTISPFWARPKFFSVENYNEFLKNNTEYTCNSCKKRFLNEAVVIVDSEGNRVNI